ncbi:hypothetical protein M3Y97_00682800 [Aphelenchoides bicaudatus]|nr:hypothetical protein M3Y97_00682800 [Aphelenchoides bicaudatus]
MSKLVALVLLAVIVLVSAAPGKPRSDKPAKKWSWGQIPNYNDGRTAQKPDDQSLQGGKPLGNGLVYQQNGQIVNTHTGVALALPGQSCLNQNACPQHFSCTGGICKAPANSQQFDLGFCKAGECNNGFVCNPVDSILLSCINLIDV